MNARDVTCDYCGGPAELVGGDAIYPHRPDLADRWFYYCAPCNAWVGCHKRGNPPIPFGRLADADLRRAKQRAHAAFDPLWKKKMKRHGWSMGRARNAAYEWLAEQLEIDVDDCHIDMFDLEMCKRVVDLCARYSRLPVS